MEKKIKYNHTPEIHNTKDALEILPFVFKLLNPNSIVDVGCGNGSWLKVAKDLGIPTVLGVDGIKLNDYDLLISENEFLKHDLTQPLNIKKRYDLALSLEVAEHLPKASADVFIKTLCDCSDYVLFSAAIPNQGGQYHINEQWPEYWNSKFKKNGYLAYDIIRKKFWDNKNVLWWYSQNTILYAREGCFNADFGEDKHINGLVHPGSYKRKIDHPKYFKSNRELFKLIVTTIKLLIKRIIKFKK